MIQPKNIIIIGGTAAGPAATAKAKRTAPYANVVLFEAGEFISTGTCELPYVLSGEINNWQDIVFFSPESFEKEKGVKVYTRHLVESIDRRKKTITIKNLISGNTFAAPYDRLILCTGSTAKKLPELPSNLKNVFSLKSVSDLISIKDYLSKNKIRTALVIGAGYIGLESAETLKTIGLEVTIFEKEKLPMPGLDDETRHLILDLLQQNKINFYGNVIQPKYNCSNEKFLSVNIEGWKREFDIVITAIGVEPNTALAAASKIELGATGAIKVDYKLKTSDPNIFAAGDCIEVTNQITNRQTYVPLATLAQQYGHIAGENAAGGNTPAPKVVRNIAVKLFDRNLVQVGMCLEGMKKRQMKYSSVRAIVPNLVKVMPGSRQVFGKIFFEQNTNKILGANFFGGTEVIGYGDLISGFIRNGIKAQELVFVNYNYTPPLSPFINLLSVLGRKIEKVI